MTDQPPVEPPDQTPDGPAEAVESTSRTPAPRQGDPTTMRFKGGGE